MVIDFLIILVMVLSVFRGYRKGISSMLFSFAAFALSIIVTFTLYSNFSDRVLETDFGEKIQISVSSGVSEYVDGISTQTLDRLPFIDISKSVKENNGDVNAISSNLTNKAVEAIVSLILFVCSYAASKLIIFLLKRIVHTASGLPIIHAIDSLLGSAGGLLFGIVWTILIYMASGYLSLIGTIPFLENQFDTSVLVMLISDLFM